MFRKPREASSTPLILPSIGRPPTPPLIQNRNDDMASNSRTPTMISRTQLPTPRATPTPASGRARAAKSSLVAKLSTSKTGTKANGNILSFFRKVEVGEENSEEELFFRDTSGDSVSHGNISPARSDKKETGMADMIPGDVGSFDETTRPGKRRRLVERFPGGSNMWEDCKDLGKIPEARFEGSVKGRTARLIEVTEPVDGFSHSATTDSSELLVKTSTSRSGPFYQEDDDSQIPELPGFDEATIERLSNDTVSGDAKDRENSDLLQNGESVKPPLLRESPSTAGADGLDRFDGFDGFDGPDDVPEDGEEYLERRWMEQQGEFEGEMDENLVPDAMDETYPERVAESEPKLSTPCPICSVNLTGVTDEQASIHVNQCLDGNTLPLPLPLPLAPSLPTPNPPVKVPPYKRFQRAAIARPGQANPPNLTASSATSAFSKLMANHTEDTAWAQAAEHEAKSRGQPAYKRVCPFYKIMPGLSICVDAFRYGKVDGCNAYFLSHFHSDHYIGLTASWCHGPIYCSRVTGNLVRQQLRVDPKWVVDLEFEVKTPVPGTDGVDITMIPANHCPGSSLFLFEKPLAKNPSKVHRILHCGDFRACPAHVEHPLLRPDVLDVVKGQTRQQKIDVCYLDTTYLTPKYAFPSQEDVIQACADMCVSLSKEIIDLADPFELAKLERAGKSMARFIGKESTTSEDSPMSKKESLIEAERSTPEDEDSILKDESICESEVTASRAESESVILSKDEGAIKREEHEEEEEEEINAVSHKDFPANIPRCLTTPRAPRPRGRLLVVIGTYSIGKERICLGIARALKSLIYAPRAKQRICAALEDAELSALLTTDPLAAQIHMQPLMEIRAETLADYLAPFRPSFARVVGFRPSGWSYRAPGSRGAEPRVRDVLFAPAWRSGFGAADLVPGRGSSRQAACYGVPYSEHSSFRELTMFVCALRIGRVIPTVNVGSRKRREEMRAWVERWEREKRTSGLFRLEDGAGAGAGAGTGTGTGGAGRW